MRRGVLALAVAIGLAIGSAIPTAAIGLTQVNLNCDDGTSTTLVVDTDTLTGLTAAVQAMIDYPAGLTCTLVQVPLPLLSFGSIALAASPGQNPFIVGGGRWQVSCDLIVLHGLAQGGALARAPGALLSLGGGQTDDLIWVNIAVNVHQRDDLSFFGTLNETIPANQSCTNSSGQTFAVGESHFSSTPVCAVIAGSTAFVTSQVTQTSGQRPFPADGSGGTVNSPGSVHF